MEDYSDLIARLRKNGDMMIPSVIVVREAADALTHLSQRVQQQALEYVSLFDQCSEALEKVAALESQLAAQKADWEAISRECYITGHADGEAEVMPPKIEGRESAEPGSSIYAECRECEDCCHIGINDSHDKDEACKSCGWSGPRPSHDKCPGCHAEGTMTAACPKCGGAYRLLNDGYISVDAAIPPAAAASEDAEHHEGAEVQSYSVGRLASGFDVIVERCRQRNGEFLWKVDAEAMCLNKSGEWEYEPLPSSRDDDFMARCRFATADKAIEAARKALKEPT